MSTTWTLYGSQRRSSRDSWEQLHRLTQNWTAAWADNNGFHLTDMPAETPVTTQLWAWTTGAWLRVRLDPPHWWAALLSCADNGIESCLDNDPDIAWCREHVEQPRITSVLHWNSTDKRIQQLRSTNAALLDHDTVQLVPLRSTHPTTATFIGSRESLPPTPSA
ncbi:hypothetical protein [Actinopolyspora halophila]|uniref:hypothetical protein n=1 Tax=Actinopolyspora halophila TaxID=1850 RepID=UPI00036FC886|nr:hypothetical protein [Actinopolyspora halophila]